MKALKSLENKKSGKQDRERKVLMGLIDFYIKTGKPVGSNTLKDAGFEDLSSATIRNYFAHLEEEGYLTQHHSSGGRVPTNAAFRLFAQEQLENPLKINSNEEKIRKLRNAETKEIASYLQEAADTLSRLSQCAVFLSAPRFDHDLVTEMKVVPIDSSRCLCVIVTDFGVIQTEIIHLDRKLTAHSAKRIEAYFQWRMHGIQKPEMEPEEEAIGKYMYNELMVRYIVGYSNFSDEETYRIGFSKLLIYPEFHDAQTLSHSLSLFENAHSMRLLLKESTKKDALLYWIGEDLSTFTIETPNCSVIAAPYYIGKQPVGALGLLGPVRMPYGELFGLVSHFSEGISESLTRNIYKYKISFRQPARTALQTKEHSLIGHSRMMLLEDKR